MKLKGWKKLEKQMFALGLEIDEEIQVFLSAEDACYPDRKIVFLNALRDGGKDEKFGENLRKTFPDAPKFPTWIYAFLHEVGHIKTVDVLDRESVEERETVKASGDHAQYFTLDSEKAATKWAVDYAKTNWIFVGWLTIEMTKAVEEFTAKNITE